MAQESCRVPCVELNKYGPSNPDNLDLCRRKWNYVRSLFVGNYKVDVLGNWVECLPSEPDCVARATNDVARIMDAQIYSDMFDTDYDYWYQNYKLKPFEQFLEWRYRYGTNALGNLPQYKRLNHIGHCWAPCPFSTQSSDLRTRHLLGLTDTDPLPDKVDHTDPTTGKIWYMGTADSGSKWGFRCDYPGCPHYLETGKFYFYN